MEPNGQILHKSKRKTLLNSTMGYFREKEFNLDFALQIVIVTKIMYNLIIFINSHEFGNFIFPFLQEDVGDIFKRNYLILIIFTNKAEGTTILVFNLFFIRIICFIRNS